MIKVVTSGLHTSIQDLGRFGFRKYGVPVSGVMDQFSAELANRLVGNDPNEALIEIAFQGPALQFEKDVLIAMAGADLSPKIDDTPISMNGAIQIRGGSTLNFGKRNYGVFCYLAIAGGMNSEKRLGSASFYPNITAKWKLDVGDVVLLNPRNSPDSNPNTSVKIHEGHFSSEEILVVPGPEYGLLPVALQKKLETLSFNIHPNSNRMAYMLNSSEDLSASEILSAPVQPGTVQLTPSGKVIVLMRDAQTTGGYARILQLTKDGLNRLAQKAPSEEIRFQMISK